MRTAVVWAVVAVHVLKASAPVMAVIPVVAMSVVVLVLAMSVAVLLQSTVQPALVVVGPAVRFPRAAVAQATSTCRDFKKTVSPLSCHACRTP